MALYYRYTVTPDPVHILPQVFQQFNPFYVVALTPLSVALFASLARKGKEPSAPRKIGMGMIFVATVILTAMCLFLGMERCARSCNRCGWPSRVSPRAALPL